MHTSITRLIVTVTSGMGVDVVPTIKMGTTASDTVTGSDAVPA